MTNLLSSTDERARRTVVPVILLLVGALAAAGCASGGQSAVRTARVASLSEAFDCAREEGPAMDFEVARADRDERLLILERVDEDVSRSNPSFQRAVDQLRVEPGPGPEGSGRDLEVTARTYHEHRTRKGLTRRQRDASDGAVEAADALLERCAVSRQALSR